MKFNPLWQETKGFFSLKKDKNLQKHFQGKVKQM